MPKTTKVRPKGTTKTKTKNPNTRTAKQSVSEKSLAFNGGLPNVLVLAKTSWSIIWRNRKTVLLITLMYGLVYLVLVLGLSSPANVSSLKKEFHGVFNGKFSSFYSGLSIFTFLVGSSASSSTPAGSAYQVIIIIVASLAIIWSLRQFYLGAKIRARDSFYHGLYPLIQYILVLLFIVIELIPLVIGLVLYGQLISGGIAVTFIEKALSIVLVAGLVGASLYLISSSLMAMYIVTLPKMTPIKALRSAKGIVKGRRWSVFRKIMFLPVLLLIAIGIIILPFILIAPSVASWIFFILSLFVLVYIHSYLYSLYRGLINEQS